MKNDYNIIFQFKNKKEEKRKNNLKNPPDGGFVLNSDYCFMYL